MAEGVPVGETGQPLIDLLIAGVEDVRAVPVYQDAVLVLPVVAVAANMVFLFQHQNLFALLLRQDSGSGSAGDSGTDDDAVVHSKTFLHKTLVSMLKIFRVGRESRRN